MMTPLQRLAKEYLKELKEEYPLLEKLTLYYTGRDDEFDDYYDYHFSGDTNNLSLLEQDQIYDRVYDAFNKVFWDMFSRMNATFAGDGNEGKIVLDFEKQIIYGDNYKVEIIRNAELVTQEDYVGGIQKVDKQ